MPKPNGPTGSAGRAATTRKGLPATCAARFGQARQTGVALLDQGRGALPQRQVTAAGVGLLHGRQQRLRGECRQGHLSVRQRLGDAEFVLACDAGDAHHRLGAAQCFLGQGKAGKAAGRQPRVQRLQLKRQQLDPQCVRQRAAQRLRGSDGLPGGKRGAHAGLFDRIQQRLPRAGHLAAGDLTDGIALLRQPVLGARPLPLAQRRHPEPGRQQQRDQPEQGQRVPGGQAGTRQGELGHADVAFDHDAFLTARRYGRNRRHRVRLLRILRPPADWRARPAAAPAARCDPPAAS